jgi:hypothetical protein
MTAGKAIAAIVLLPITVLVGGIGGCEARKAYYDWQVRQMCEKDGGVAIVERVPITQELANRLPRVGGYIGIAPEALAAPIEPAFSLPSTRTIREGNPTLLRTEEKILLRNGRRPVALVVTYSRAGGDFPFTGSAPSFFQCPDPLGLYKQISNIYQVTEGSR